MLENTVAEPKVLLSWETYEYEAKEHHPDWHWYAGLVSILSAVIAFFVHNIFFGIFLIVAGTIVIIYSRRAPDHWKVMLMEDGVRINDINIPYSNIKGWWLDETSKQDKLLLAIRGQFIPMLAISLDGITADIVRKTLDGKAPESPLRESAGVKIFDRLGF